MHRLPDLVLAWLFAAALALPAAAQPAPATGERLAVVRPDGQVREHGAAELRALPRETVQATSHDKPAAFTGSDLRELLRAAGVEPPQQLRGAALRRVVLVSAADGYAVAFAAAELDPTLGDRKVLVADRVDDKPLAAEDGPWRLVVPKDARGARWVRQVTRISVIDLK